MNKPSPIDWGRLRQSKQAEVESLRGLRLSEVTPSRRDLTQFLGRGREELAVIGVLRRRDPWSGATWDDLDVAAAAASLDDADIAAIGVSTEPLFHGGRPEDVSIAAAGATAPILRDDFLLHPLQVFHSRMLGADACVAPAAWMDAATRTELTRTAASLHMTAILAVFSPEEVASLSGFERHAVGIWALDDDGGLDVPRLRQIAALLSRDRPLVLLGDVLTATAMAEARGLVDAVLVARALHTAEDPAAALVPFLEDAG
jgi:indole-3-glycerol phosphate synthase